MHGKTKKPRVTHIMVHNASRTDFEPLTNALGSNISNKIRYFSPSSDALDEKILAQIISLKTSPNEPRDSIV